MRAITLPDHIPPIRLLIGSKDSDKDTDGRHFK
jgi:hypothetical protein